MAIQKGTILTHCHIVKIEQFSDRLLLNLDRVFKEVRC